MLPAERYPADPRLSLRHFTPDDSELFYRIHNDERVMRYAGGAARARRR